MTVAENFLLVRDPIPLVVDWPKEKQRLREFMNAMPFKLDIDTPVSQLSAGEKQKLEILKELFFRTQDSHIGRAHPVSSRRRKRMKFWAC